MKICHRKADYSDNYTECGTLQGVISQAFKVSWQHYTKCLSKNQISSASILEMHNKFAHGFKVSPKSIVAYSIAAS